MKEGRGWAHAAEMSRHEFCCWTGSKGANRNQFGRVWLSGGQTESKKRKWGLNFHNKPTKEKVRTVEAAEGRTRLHTLSCQGISPWCLSIAPFQSGSVGYLQQSPVSASLINMRVPLHQPQLQINQRVGRSRNGANISSISPQRRHGGMQIASQETPGDVKEKLAGRQREANESNGKCIQGVGEALLYSYQLIQSYQWRRTVEAGSNPWSPSQLAHWKHLDRSAQPGPRSLALREAGPGLGS